MLSSKELSKKYNCSISTITNLWGKYDLKNKIKHVYSLDENYFSKIDTDIKAYFLGFIAADGNIRKDFLKMRIELNIQDYSHLEKFRKSIQGENPIVESIRPKNHSCYIDVNCKDFCLALNNLGITPKKSLTLKIDFSLIPKELRNHFIRGYFDGDGSINKYLREGKNYYEWERFGSILGVLLQMTDDLLDVTGNFDDVGKRVGKDEGEHKATCVRLYGLEGAKLRAEICAQNCHTTLESIDGDTSFLHDMIDEVLNRKK